MSREALQLSFGGPDAIEAFAAMLLGDRPFDPSDEARHLARMAREVARDRSVSPARDREHAALRALYALARDRSAEIHAPPAAAHRGETRAALALRLMLSLRHRQRAALALRYVLGLDRRHTGQVLGLSPKAADAVLRAGLASVARAAGSKMDVRRNLVAAGRSLPKIAAEAGPETEAPTPRREARPVFQLLLAPVAAIAPDVPPDTRERLRPVVDSVRPVYGPLAKQLPLREPRAPRQRQVRWKDGLVALAAAIVALGVLTIAPHAQHISPAPLAVVPIAPAVANAAPSHAAGPVASTYRVRAGDTLWSIATRLYKDPLRWRTLWHLNAGRSMSDGARFVDPDLIRPGWVLALSR